MRLTKSKMVGALIVGILLVIGAIWVKVNYLEAGAALVSKWEDVDYAMRLNVQGEDLRVYEFTPQSTSGVTCIFVAGTNKASLFCVPKSKTPTERVDLAE